MSSGTKSILERGLGFPYGVENPRPQDNWHEPVTMGGPGYARRRGEVVGKLVGFLIYEDEMLDLGIIERRLDSGTVVETYELENVG